MAKPTIDEKWSYLVTLNAEMGQLEAANKNLQRDKLNIEAKIRSNSQHISKKLEAIRQALK